MALKSLTFIIASLIESDQQLFCFFCAVIFLFLLDFCKLALLSLQSGWRSDHPHFGNSCHKYCLCTFAKIGWINLGELLSTHETEWSLSIAFSLAIINYSLSFPIVWFTIQNVSPLLPFVIFFFFVLDAGYPLCLIIPRAREVVIKSFAIMHIFPCGIELICAFHYVAMILALFECHFLQQAL